MARSSLILIMSLLSAAMLPQAAANAQVQPETQMPVMQQLDEMQGKLKAAQQQIDADHAEMIELRRQVETLRQMLAPVTGALTTGGEVSSSSSAADLAQAVADIEEHQVLQQAEIAVHEQTKVETTSKYHLALHGLVLFNAAANDGAVDQSTLPALALRRIGDTAHGSLTGTARQTLIGLSSTGPDVFGAHTYADVEMDFAGGVSPGTYTNGGNLFRLRTASLQMVWPAATVEAGVSPLILTPYFATSYFSIAEPALSWSGAFWNWLPQLSVEQHFVLGEKQLIRLQAAVVDVPDAPTNANTGLGLVSAAERSRYPGSELRTSYVNSGGLPVTIGFGGYWSPHRNTYGGSFDAWAGTMDWKLSLPLHLQFSGQIYRGAGLGGLNAGTYKDSVLTYQQASLAGIGRLAGLRNAGGWTQMKFNPAERFELNAAFGLDDADAKQLRAADLDLTNPFIGLARNQTGFVNLVFRPRSTFILSAEYRRIHSWQITGPFSSAQLFGLAAGYEF